MIYTAKCIAIGNTRAGIKLYAAKYYMRVIDGLFALRTQCVESYIGAKCWISEIDWFLSP